MSYLQAREPKCIGAEGALELVIVPRERDLGDLTVRRVLPAAERRMVGPFIFFDHMGPAEFPPGTGIQVRPHPHIGIATITYLFDGEILHRDSLGVTQLIREGAVNLMTAGRGIVHSERAGEDLEVRSQLHGIQSWMALPDDAEECEPAFVHVPAGDLPDFEHDGVRVRVIVGEAWGHRSPVQVPSTTLYLELRMPAGAVLTLPDDVRELAAYVVTGVVHVDHSDHAGGTMLVVAGGRSLTLEAREDSRVMVVGGDPVGRRHIWWNFVSSSRERIEQAKADWRENRFDPVPGDPEMIPLPE